MVEPGALVGLTEVVLSSSLVGLEEEVEVEGVGGVAEVSGAGVLLILPLKPVAPGPVIPCS